MGRTAITAQCTLDRLLERQMHLAMQALDHLGNLRCRGRLLRLRFGRSAAATTPQPQGKQQDQQEQQQFHPLLRPSKTSTTKREPT
jgi:hypothetical protein